MSSHIEQVRQPVRVAIVHYRDSAEGGGSLRVGETIANHLDPARVSAQMVFAYGAAGPVANSVRVPSHFIGARGPKDFAAWFRARALFKELRPDLIHFQDGIVWLRAALAGTRYRTLLHVHGRYCVVPQGGTRDSISRPFRASKLLRRYLRHTDAQVCINRGARDALLELGWISRENSFVVYNSVDTSRFDGRQNADEARDQLGLPKDALLLGMVCRLVWEKGCADLLSLIGRLPTRWHGVICGDGPLREQLEQECQRRGIVDRIHFLGLQDDVAPVYAALDAYAFLSRYEPFGLVLAEAMAAGVPVFGIEGDGEYKEAEYPLFTVDAVDLIKFAESRDNEAGLPDQTLDEIAHRVSNYGDHPEQYSQMIDRARRWVRTRFAAPLQAEAIMRVYEHVCGSQRGALELSTLYDPPKQAVLHTTEVVVPGSAGAGINSSLSAKLVAG